MCLKWWKRPRHGNQPRAHKQLHDGDEATTYSSDSRVSAFSSTDHFFTSSSTSSAFAGGFIKDLLPQGPLIYKRSEIAAATLNFAASQQIGSSAWKGVLRGCLVAIVRKPGVAKNFHKLLRDVHSLHHSNLVKVMGGCPTAECAFVVYEFVHADDLESCLCSTLVPGYTVLSTWRLRMQVALDVAKGLEYAHQLTAPYSAHKYLTSSNVLLMKETLRAKLALVGMSTLSGEFDDTEAADYVPHKGAPSHTRLDKDTGTCMPQEGDVSERRNSLRSVKIKGTRGYMPPEYLLSGVVSHEYDVFTYGIVLLELLKGVGAHNGGEQRKTIRKISLVDEVRTMMEDTNGMKGRLRLWIDRRLNDSYPVEDAVKVVDLAMSCGDENPQKRPQMKEVALQVAILLDSAEAWERERSTMSGTGTLQGR